jgi:hypothetical protein
MVCVYSEKVKNTHFKMNIERVHIEKAIAKTNLLDLYHGLKKSIFKKFT